MVKGSTTKSKGRRVRKAAGRLDSPITIVTRSRDGKPRRVKYYRVDPPNFDTEQVIYYFQDAPKLIQKILKFHPSRASLSNYKDAGYPVRRGGPFIEMPIADINKRPHTTVEAIKRWCTLVQSIKNRL